MISHDEDHEGEDEEGDWRTLINQSWAKEWRDPREDIYAQ